MVMRTRDDGFGDEPKRRIMLGTYALSSGYYDAYYGTAQKVRTVIKREHDAVFERFDLLVSPTSPTIAFELGAKIDDPLAMYLNDVLTIPSSMAGLPGLSIPCGLSEGLPVGLQLIGPQFSENTLFKAGHALEQAIGFDVVPGAAAMSNAWEAVIGLEIHVQLKTRDEDVLPLPQRLRRRAEHADLPGVPRVPRRAARCRTGARSRRRSSSGWRSTARSRSARSSTARTTSTPTFRRRTRSASTTSRSARTASSPCRRPTATS